jgi:Tfp pilus assembly protein PilO
MTREFVTPRTTWIVGICLAAAAVLYMMFFFVPSMASIRTTLSDLQSKHGYILDAQNTQRVANQLQNELDATIEYVDTHRHQVLEPAEVPALLSQISHVTKTRGVTTTKFEPQPAIPYETLHKLSIVLGMTGRFQAVYGTLSDLERLDAQIWIEDIKFHGPREAGKSTDCEATLVVFVDNPEKSD